MGGVFFHIRGAHRGPILRLLAACWCALLIGGATPALAAETIAYWGGPVVAQVKVVPVFWSSHVNSLVQQNMQQFFSDAVNSPWYDALMQYSTNGVSGGTKQTIVRGTAETGVVLTPSRCSGIANCTVTDAQLQAELLAQITAGKLPTPDDNTAYMVFIPPNVTVTLDGGSSGVTFCAYNSTTQTSGGQAFPYGLVMDTFTGSGATGCGSNTMPLENETQTAAATLANLVTDPLIGFVTGNNVTAPAAWFGAAAVTGYPNGAGQVGDACVSGGPGPTITVSGRTWVIAPIFSNITNSCTRSFVDQVPAVTLIGPTKGPTTGGTSVTISGTNFTGTTAVNFGITTAASFAFFSNTELTAIAPAGRGTVNVTVTNGAGTSATGAADEFIYRPATHDLNGDGYSDIVWSDGVGDSAFWIMKSAAVLSTGVVSGVPNTWSIVGQRDFDGDGNADLLWRDTSGDNAIWFMNGGQISSAAVVASIGGTWNVAGVADFDGNGKADVLWRDGSGNLAVWLMNGATVASAAGIGNLPTTWSVVGTGDYNGDGKSDLLFRDNLGNNAIWFMNGTTVTSGAGAGNVPTSWTVVGTGDFNGDGMSDILWRDNLGDASVWLMNGAGVLSAGGLGNISTTWSIALVGDFNGDGMSDILWRDTSGDIVMWFMNGVAVGSQAVVGNVPTNWTVQSAGAE
jgi:hypothetical protein